ncbi:MULTISPECIES: alpha/beta fold hydrolase [Streptacidiphilus]|uniref:Alpha/beta fold hydrolase n=1 Tax=Streptacidiphilus cavernicola TaxID=3342716 RepID=A0ABV6UKA3_9ACTN|nr:alpha/beta hydrolase [Streptacidiphilus jeojiense]
MAGPKQAGSTRAGAGVALHCRDSGTGEDPVLLVHGWGGSGVEWRPLVTALGPGRRTIVPDLRGHGDSPDPAHGYAPADFAGDLARLLLGLGTGPVTVAGHSMGAQIAVELATAHPESVSRLLLLDPAFGADEAEMRRIPGEQRQLRAEGTPWAVRFAGTAHGPDTAPAIRELHRRLMSAMDPAVLAEARDAMYLAPSAFGSRPAAEARLRALSCPVLTVMTTEERAAWARRALPGGRVELLRGGHYLHEEHPTELASLFD